MTDPFFSLLMILSSLCNLFSTLRNNQPAQDRLWFRFFSQSQHTVNLIFD